MEQGIETEERKGRRKMEKRKDERGGRKETGERRKAVFWLWPLVNGSRRKKDKGTTRDGNGDQKEGLSA